MSKPPDQVPSHELQRLDVEPMLRVRTSANILQDRGVLEVTPKKLRKIGLIVARKQKSFV